MQVLALDAPRLKLPDHELTALESLHHQVHTLAESLCELQMLGRAEEARCRLPSLHALREALLAQLSRLLPQAAA